MIAKARRFCLFFILCFYSVILTLTLNSCSFSENNNNDVIRVWHWMSDREEAFLELAKQYEEDSGIKVKFELYAPSDSYSKKIRAAAQTNSLPDIFGILGEKSDFASYIKAGHIYDLTSSMNENNKEWRNKFLQEAVAVNEFEENNTFGIASGVYGVPIDFTTIKMLYNKDLLKEAGWDQNKPPVSWDQFTQVSKLLKNKSIQGLVSGWGETWMVNCFASNYAFNIMGEKKVLDTIKGKESYNDPDWIKVFNIFKDMREEDILANGVVTMVNKTAEQLFSNNKAAFAFNGSWCVNVYRSMNPDLNYGVMLPPRVSKKFPMKIWGGAGSSFMVNKNSRNKDKAIQFLKWLTDTKQQSFLAQKTNNLPSNKESLKDIPKVLSQFADDVEQITHPGMWEVSEFPMVIEKLTKGIQSIIIGEKTPEELAKELDIVKKREMAKETKN